MESLQEDILNRQEANTLELQNNDNYNLTQLQNWMQIPKKYYTVLFKDLKGIDDKIRQAKDAVATKQNITLIGPCGTGKTHLAICLMRMAWSISPCLGLIPLFISIPDLILQIKNSWKHNDNERGLTETEWINKLSNVSLLVLDDLGVGNQTDWATSVLYNIIDKRYRDCKQTIITSNLSLSNISEKIDDRISSRLCDGLVVELQGKDWRIAIRTEPEILRREE